jgi:predicted small secreted protein
MARSIIVGALALVFGGAAMLTTTGCQTIQGVGKDVQSAAEASERAIHGNGR